jgi:two-component system cell cycle response regulator
MRTTRASVVIGEGRPEVAGLITAYLISEGHEVRVGGSAAETLQLVRDARPDLLILSSTFDSEGVEVCRRLKADDAGRQTPVIFLAPRQSVDRRIDAREAGADDVLSEPVERTELLLRVESQLRVRSLLERLEAATVELDELKAQWVPTGGE